MKHFVTACLTLAITLGCKTTPDSPTDFESAALMGMIYSASSQPILGMQITIDEERIVQSDIEGRFIFTEISRGNHRISAILEGYEPIEFEFAFTDRTQVLHLIATSIYDLIQQYEEAIATRNWARLDELGSRIEAIEPDYPDYYYLRALAAYIWGDFDGALAYLDRLEGNNVSSIWIDRLRELSARIDDSNDTGGAEGVIDETIEIVDPDAPEESDSVSVGSDPEIRINEGEEPGSDESIGEQTDNASELDSTEETQQEVPSEDATFEENESDREAVEQADPEQTE